MSNRSIARIDHDHPLLHDVPSLHDFGQLFVIRRSHRTCTSRFLRDFVILCITITKDAMFEIAQVLEHKHESIESGYHRNANVLHRLTVVGREIVNDRVVSRLSFWLVMGIFRSEERTNDEYI